MKKAILVVSFGSSYEETLKKNIEKVENDIREEYKDFTVRRSFTSSMIIRKLKGRGIEINNPEEAIAELVSEGYQEIYLQPLHIIPGFEFEKIKHAVSMARHKFKETKIVLSKPLLYHEADYRNVINAVSKELDDVKPGHGYLFMGHGTEHPANATYSQLQNMWSKERDDIVIANVEGYPEIDDVMDSITDRYKSMTLIPLMLVAGDHAINDMSSDDEDSFKSVLEAEGLSVDCELKGLGERPDIRRIFVDKIKDLI